MLVVHESGEYTHHESGEYTHYESLLWIRPCLYKKNIVKKTYSFLFIFYIRLFFPIFKLIAFLMDW